MPTYQSSMPDGNAPNPNNMVSDEPLPSFVKGWMITDLVFSIIRALIALLGLVGLGIIKSTDPLYIPGIFEVATNGGMAFFGIIAAVMILNKKESGIPIAYMTMLFTLANLGVAIWQAVGSNESSNDAEKAGFIVGVMLAFAIRLTLLGFYFSAVNQAKAFLGRSSPFGSNDNFAR